ncbi:MAG: hypothetical protein GC181_08965 [Bacteroidetes bacterium]|nr:hypothetical protein [Bacteroidota bacterium]
MYKKSLLLFLIFIWAGFAFTKSNLHLEIEKQLNEANEMMFSGLTEVARVIIDKNLKIAIEKGDKDAEVLALERLAVWYLFTGDSKNGMIWLNRGIEKAIKLQDSIPLALLLGNRAYEFARKNEFQPAIHDALRALNIFETYRDTAYMLNGYNSVGYIFSLSNQPEKAERYYRKELDLALFGGYKKEISIAYDNLAILFGETNRSPELAKSYHIKSLRIAEEIDDKEGQAAGHSNLANRYVLESNFDSAEWHGLKAVKMAEAIGYFDLVQEVHLTLSTVFLNKKQFKRSVEEARQVLEWAESNENVDHQTKAFGNLSKAYSELGQFDSAFYFLQKLKNVEDEFKKQETLKNIHELETKYETSKKELQIEKGRSEIRKRNLWLAIAFGLIALVITLFVGWRNAALQRARLKEAELNRIQQRYEIDVLNSLVEGEERERSRIARELHDGVNGILSAVKLNVQTVSNPALTSMVENAISEVRNISHNLMPANLVKFGLQEALQDYVDSINSGKALQVELNFINVNTTLRKTVELTIYRIIQELMNNIIKHSEATKALIQLSQNEDILMIAVEDNGKGFSPGTESNGIGMQTIKERIKVLNGTLEIDSANEVGTSVNIEIHLTK